MELLASDVDGENQIGEMLTNKVDVKQGVNSLPFYSVQVSTATNSARNLLTKNNLSWVIL